MSDEKRPAAESGTTNAETAPQKEVTPEQYGSKYEKQQAEKTAEIQNAYGVSDAYGQMQKLMEGLPFGAVPSAGGLFGRTNFDQDKIRLNDMLDLIQDAKPSDLENAGDALIKAKDKLNEAAEELDQYVTRVEWKGEGAEEFRRFGRALAQHAWSIGTFANSAGSQMKTASTGLASVRGSMPPRDGRLDQRIPDDFPIIAQVQDNQEYQAAVKVEGDRQEAITQMNRLSSFYAVSEQMLAKQAVPTFPEGLKAAVPPPRGDGISGVDGGGPAAAPAGTASPAGIDGTTPAGVGKSGTATGVAAAAPPPSASMQIDTVAAPPAPPSTTGPTAPVTTPPTGPTTGPVPPFSTGPANPVQTGKRGLPPSTGTSRTTGPLGRPGTTGTNGPTTGRSPGITGRPTAVGNGQTTPGRANPVGRPGIVGGTPTAKPAGTTGQAGPVGRPGTGGIRAGNPNGIMGGSPHRAGAGSATSRMPRGTVVGGEGTTAGRGMTARPGQSGVVGSNPAGAPRSTGRGTPGSNGIVGAARGGAPGRRQGGAFTAGGAGLAGNRTGRRRPDEEEQSGSERPDYLTEDEETWAARRRDAVPPVIE
ncbi:hypothetical protein ACIBI4_29460 [Streptomyces sp. NPDC050418]|uniref:hypothetical protein n=1 Tax=Streptomyces sp. NPDC050418 TaxID=3365612 RepID=UPI00379A52B6